jgi:hypothetical protein
MRLTIGGLSAGERTSSVSLELDQPRRAAAEQDLAVG